MGKSLISPTERIVQLKDGTDLFEGTFAIPLHGVEYVELSFDHTQVPE